MQKLESKTIEQIVSVVISVILLSVFSTFVQSSRAEQEPMPVSIASVESEIAKKTEEIRLLELKKFSQQKTAFTDEDLARLLYAVGFEGKALKTAWAVVKKEVKWSSSCLQWQYKNRRFVLWNLPNQYDWRSWRYTPR
jgi:hypothetical protein